MDPISQTARLGSKHYLVTEAQGIPLGIILTGANCHDVTQRFQGEETT
ncbi:hypothetical protein PAMC26577_35775 [Caballeronia sordidicola]|uniref:Uncharacterized protein n=1 Tax=Caballeronia sordidicola TaxID=196367 RepID=A0A242M904_CABSO|nr:hypothetical protein PAMC26577_35775 [Caballeronia sordidicola]